MTIVALSLITAAVLLLAAGYLLGRWHGAELAERDALAAVDGAGPDAQVRGSGGDPSLVVFQ